MNGLIYIILSLRLLRSLNSGFFILKLVSKLAAFNCANNCLSHLIDKGLINKMTKDSSQILFATILEVVVYLVESPD